MADNEPVLSSSARRADDAKRRAEGTRDRMKLSEVQVLFYLS